MRLKNRIEVMAWSIWTIIPKPWRYRKYRKILEKIQQAVKKKKMDYNFPKETCIRIAERDGNECLFCRTGYHMDLCRSEMLFDIPDIMHYINKSQGGLGIEENGVLGCRFHHGLLDNGNRGFRPEMLAMMREHLMECYPDWDENSLVYKKWNF